MNIGIYGISSQSGKAYLADFIKKGQPVIGYARPTPNGKDVVEAIHNNRGIYLERPENSNNEQSGFIELGNNIVTNDIRLLTKNADIIIVAIPSHFHQDVACELCEHLNNKKIPLILSPSRTIASPYLWKILGNNYPIVCFSTSPYSSKTFSANSVYIKRRKRTWLASYEGDFSMDCMQEIENLFPQVTFTHTPALTSLNNIGAIFHPIAYLLNFDEISRRKKEGAIFSFYMEGIASKPEIGNIIEKVDQIRLQIADKLGIPTFGLNTNPREDVWKKITGALRVLEEENENDIEVLRKTRSLFLEYVNNCVISAQHWLDITYGVERVPGEKLTDAIGKTPTYQNNSVAQERYATEDVPTGLVPLEALAEMLDIEHQEITMIIDLFDSLYNESIRNKGRSLRGFDKSFVLSYLKGFNN